MKKIQILGTGCPKCKKLTKASNGISLHNLKKANTTSKKLGKRNVFLTNKSAVNCQIMITTQREATLNMPLLRKEINLPPSTISQLHPSLLS